MPLTSGGLVTGKFMLYHRMPHVFIPEEADVALIIARQLGFSIERNEVEKTRWRAEDHLRRNRARLKQILDSATEYAIITLDSDGRIASWNSGAERLLGYEESEVIGLPGEIFFTPEDRDAGLPQQEMKLASSEGRAANERWHMPKTDTLWGSGVMLPIEEGGQDAISKSSAIKRKNEGPNKDRSC